MSDTLPDESYAVTFRATPAVARKLAKRLAAQLDEEVAICLAADGVDGEKLYRFPVYIDAVEAVG